MGCLGRHLIFWFFCVHSSLDFYQIELNSHFSEMSAAGKIVNASKAYILPRWSTFLKYVKTELTPPSPGEIPQAIAQATRLVASATTMQFRHTTVREAAINTAVVIEVACWFFIGECIGKGGLIGYDV